VVFAGPIGGCGTLQFGIRAKVSKLSLDGMDKWSLDPRFQVEWCSGEPVSNLRMLLSAKGLLDRVMKLRSSSGRINCNRRGIWPKREREINTWGVGAIRYVWKERKDLYNYQIWRKHRRVNLEAL
jgi:hypothetical protein